MTRADDRLIALFAYDEPPPRDPEFTVRVMEAAVRRRFLADVAGLTGATLLGGAALWALWPVLDPALVSLSQGLAPAVAAAAVALCALAMLAGRPGAVLGLES